MSNLPFSEVSLKLAYFMHVCMCVYDGGVYKTSLMLQSLDEDGRDGELRR